MKHYIKTKLREGLLREMFFIDPKMLNSLVKLGSETSFDNPNMAKSYVSKTLNNLNKLPDVITLYRVVFANKKEDINTNEIGDHYVLSRTQLEQSHQQISHVGGGKPFLLVVKTPKELIDLNVTLKNQVMYPHENEITLLNKGKGAKVIKIEDFIARDEFEDWDL